MTPEATPALRGSTAAIAVAEVVGIVSASPEPIRT